MKKVIVLASLLFGFAITAQAAVISGNDIATQFTLTAAAVANIPTSGVDINSGYWTVANATTPDVAFNPFAASPSTFAFNGGSFDLNGFIIAGAWGTQTLTINGYDGASLLFSSNVFVGPSVATNFVANWEGITAFEILIGSDFTLNSNLIGDGQHWALNNISINEEVSSVPLPAAAFLFGPAALGLFGLRRKLD